MKFSGLVLKHLGLRFYSANYDICELGQINLDKVFSSVNECIVLNALASISQGYWESGKCKSTS